ncbi:MAG TPA: MupA/Atu3671 family FMN-dependent luciferase-like monooxygenase [Pyrinomonadaceae bacterium]|nr:MupA/Atu3671 family FMN-dependent luciferase-like monooxygenase [Pyrinomonadaceae bacterium]
MKNVADVYHLTPVQREALRNERVAQSCWKIHGELDSGMFERAWQQVLARHAMLRTCFLTQELKEPVQVVRQQVKLNYERRDGNTNEHQNWFDSARAPLFRLMEIRVGPASHEVVLNYHPVLLDEHSVALLFEEVLALYGAAVQNAECVLEDASAFRDYVSWVERQDLSGAELYWRNAFASPSLRCSFGAYRTESLAKFVPASREVNFSAAQTDALKTFARDEGLSIETLLTGAWAIVLMRERNCSEISVGAVAQKRPLALPRSEQIVGLLANVLPLPIALANGESMSSWLLDVENAKARVNRYAHVSCPQIRQWLDVAHDTPLFDNAVIVHEKTNTHEAGLTIEGVTNSELANDIPLRLEAVLGDELSLRLHAHCEDAERTAIRLIYSLHNTLASLVFPALYLSERSEPARVEHPPQTDKPLEFSLFYFADDNAVYGEDKYRLYREGAMFADRHRLTAVWTPERHFHEKAGLYPNPSVLSAALAMITKHVQLRAGSVVLPLHNSLRVAEEWSVVDNLSKGRVGISFTSGWMPNDFAFFPERYPTKREEMFRAMEEVQELWRGNAIPGRDGVGKEIEVRIFPKPINPELPIWLTCSGGPEMFEKAGELGVHVLTALLTQSIEEVAPKIQLYRDSLVRHGFKASDGKVTMMMHTYIGEDADAVLQKVRVPLTKYLKSHMNLIETGAQSLNLGVDIKQHDDPEKYRDQMAAFAFERYYRTSSLIGTPATCMKMIERLKEIGVDEVACLIDFGVEVDSVLESLDHLVVLQDLSNAQQPEANLLATTAAHS